nr:MAG TPA: hypothetical protein [Caudoviricetes sp.]
MERLTKYIETVLHMNAYVQILKGLKPLETYLLLM